jgi:hypothetical protein
VASQSKTPTLLRILLILAVAALAYGATVHVHEAETSGNSLEPICTWCLVAPTVVFLTIVAVLFSAPAGFVPAPSVAVTIRPTRTRVDCGGPRAPPRS